MSTATLSIDDVLGAIEKVQGTAAAAANDQQGRAMTARELAVVFVGTGVPGPQLIAMLHMMVEGSFRELTPRFDDREYMLSFISGHCVTATLLGLRLGQALAAQQRELDAADRLRTAEKGVDHA